MGLGGGRKRVKIGNDPNNETWARSTGNYGHRMLISQGWTPGGTLGLTGNAAYSAHLTEGSHSHIKVKPREDNLGLGAKRGSGQDAGECVGLDAFQGLLGRLNGKSDEALEKEQRSRDDLKRARYMELRGTVRFVRGGTLVHDMEELIELARRSRISMGLEKDSEKGIEDGAKLMKSKQKKGSRKEAATQEDEGDNGSETQPKAKPKSKKRKRREVETSNEELQEDSRPALSLRKASEVGSNSDSSEDEKAAKARRKAARAERREQKRQRREEKAAKKTAAAAALAEASLVKEEADAGPVVQETLVVEPAATQETKRTVQQEPLGGRHTSVRSRYIAAKRRAVMDPQALKEILMVKA